MQQVKLAAFDMDGTLLQSNKTFSPVVLHCLKEVVKQDGIIVLNTGRPLAELCIYEQELRPIRYVIAESGALLYDRQDQKILARHLIDPAAVKNVLEESTEEDIEIQVITAGRSIVSRHLMQHMASYHLEDYVSLYQAAAEPVDDIPAYIKGHEDEIEKLNLYHTNTEARSRTAGRLQGSPCTITDSEHALLEISPLHIDKGSGLLELLKWISIPREETIAAGDAPNDIPAFQAAGRGIAMENAELQVKQAADEICPDCDHDGTAWIMKKYLLNF